MQVTPDISWQAVEPTGAVTGRESRLEGIGVGGIVDDGGDKARRGGGQEDREDGAGGKGRGEGVG